MLLFTLHNTWKCIYMAARLLLYPRVGGATWRAALRSILAPALGCASLGALVLAATTDTLHRNYDLLLHSTVPLMFVASACWAVRSAQPPGGLGRRAGQLHLFLFLVGIALKVLDDKGAVHHRRSARLAAAAHRRLPRAHRGEHAYERHAHECAAQPRRGGRGEGRVGRSRTA